MITYSIWESFIEDFDCYTTNGFKILIYSFLSFFSIITISLDIIALPFEIIGITIFSIEKIRRRGK